jgi:hypothetical protein
MLRLRGEGRFAPLTASLSMTMRFGDYQAEALFLRNQYLQACRGSEFGLSVIEGPESVGSELEG